jgi:hypothetical protein
VSTHWFTDAITIPCPHHWNVSARAFVSAARPGGRWGKTGDARRFKFERASDTKQPNRRRPRAATSTASPGLPARPPRRMWTRQYPPRPVTHGSRFDLSSLLPACHAGLRSQESG